MIPIPPAIVFRVTPLWVPKFLDAIAQVESENDWKKIGAKGERTIWQFKRATWNQHARGVPFELSAEPQFRSYAEKVAREHVAWLILKLTERNLPITPENTATCWRFGFSQGSRLIRQGKIPDSSQRVRNLYDLNP
jgi:hypothetical protein